MSVPLSPACTGWRAARSDNMDLSNSTTSNISYDSLISDGSSATSAMSASLNGFDIASLIASQGLSSLAQYRSLSAPAAYRTLSRVSAAPQLPMIPSIGSQPRLPAEYLVCGGLTPPPSPGSSPYHNLKHEQLLPSPKRQNSQPAPSGLYNIPVPLTRNPNLVSFSAAYPGLHMSNSSSKLSCDVPPVPIRCSSEITERAADDNTADDTVERTTSGKRKRLIEDDYVMIEPVKKEPSVQQDMRDLFEEIVQTRAILNQLKTAQNLSKRKERSRLNSLLDRKIKRFKEMRLSFLESCLTLENASLRNTIDKVKAELEFCANRGIEQVISISLATQIDDLLSRCVSGDVKSFFAASIGISNDNTSNIIEEDE